MALGPHPEFSWSTSRERAFGYCRRQYWFQYYGSWGGWEDDAPQRTKDIYGLKQRTSIKMWAGTAVHRGVALMLAGAGSLEQVTEQIHQEMRRDYLVSVRREFLRPGRAKAFGLDVHAYDEDVPPERFRDMWATVEASLRTFAELPYWGLYREAVAAGRYAAAEPPDGGDFDARRFHWPEVGDFPIFAQPDLVYERADGRVEILDWKTGRLPTRRPAEELTLQLRLYAHLVRERHPDHPPATRLVAAEVYLPSGDRFGRALQPADLEAAAAEVAESAEAMRALLDDPVRNIASEERFALTEGTQKCPGCLFRRLCPRWDEIVSSRQPS